MVSLFKLKLYYWFGKSVICSWQPAKKLREAYNNMDSISEQLTAYRQLQKDFAAQKPADLKKIKIAVLASSTIKALEECLFVQTHRLSALPEIYVGAYNQYNQEILDPNSGLYRFSPDLTILFIDTMALLGDNYFDFNALSAKEKSALFAAKISQIEKLVGKLEQGQTGKVLLHNFAIPLSSPLGIIDNKQPMGLFSFVAQLNAKLLELYKNNNRVFVFDYELFCSKWGKENIIDYKMYYLGDIKLNLQYIPRLCEEYIAYLIPMLSLTRKCAVLDLDNTLWGGIIGEDGIEGIYLDPSRPEGRPFLDFQKYLLALHNRGVILAINSKNNEEDALLVLRNHPYMVLKEKHFAAIKINWNDKISNMRAIAQEINIGLDSLVFFDDDKLNREMISKALPEVKVVNLPSDPALYLKTLTDLPDFNSFYYSDEDRKKGQIYAQQRKRRELSTAVTDIKEYLQALDMEITIEEANSFSIPRIAQLTQKTNQFNLTTNRYQEEDIKEFAGSPDYFVFSVKVADKFGDNGITGVAVVQKDKNSWTIDTFLLSCRVIGRMVEDVMLGHMLAKARQAGVAKIIGEFIPTKKNIPARDFFKKNGFKLIAQQNDNTKWELETATDYSFPNFIRVIEK